MYSLKYQATLLSRSTILTSLGVQMLPDDIDINEMFSLKINLPEGPQATKIIYQPKSTC